jgi:hypothetical protein
MFKPLRTFRPFRNGLIDLNVLNGLKNFVSLALKIPETGLIRIESSREKNFYYF